ncbi:MAG: 50S ribosomal protein L25/general stress protein Ctc [Dehalococcoidia bacterium]
MAQRAPLRAAPRTVLGKKVKRLRADGILPANVYGRGLTSTPIQLDAREFLRTIKDAGVRSMFDLTIDGEKEPRLVLIRGLHREAGMGDPIHVDFFQVDLQRPLQTSVAINLVGTAPAVADHGGTLLQMLETLPVRCLPLDIPSAIEADVSVLKSFDATITVGDLEIPPSVEVLLDDAVAVATVNPPRLRLVSEEEEEEAAAEAEEAEKGEEAAPAEETADGSGDEE